MDARNHSLTQANPAPMCGRFDANDRFVTTGGAGLCSGDGDCTGGDICYVDLATEPLERVEGLVV